MEGYGVEGFFLVFYLGIFFGGFGRGFLVNLEGNYVKMNLERWLEVVRVFFCFSKFELGVGVCEVVGV